MGVSRFSTASRAGVGEVLIALIAVLSGCAGERSDVACLQSTEPAIILEIRDSASGAGLAAHAVATVVDGGFSDTLYFLPGPDSAYRAGPDERPGDYDLQVTAAGYQSWALNGVTVPDGICSVQTVRLHARLAP